MEETLKRLKSALDASDTALRLAEESVNASRNVLAQTSLIFDSIKDSKAEAVSELVKRCDNCHENECRGRLKL